MKGPVFQLIQLSLLKSRKEQVIISRLLFGHTRPRYSFILKQVEQPQCIKWQTPINTVKRFLIECGELPLIWQSFFNANDMKRDTMKGVHQADDPFVCFGEKPDKGIGLEMSDATGSR